LSFIELQEELMTLQNFIASNVSAQTRHGLGQFARTRMIEHEPQGLRIGVSHHPDEKNSPMPEPGQLGEACTYV
jgi:hypothetical protein